MNNFFKYFWAGTYFFHNGPFNSVFLINLAGNHTELLASCPLFQCEDSKELTNHRFLAHFREILTPNGVLFDVSVFVGVGVGVFPGVLYHFCGRHEGGDGDDASVVVLCEGVEADDGAAWLESLGWDVGDGGVGAEGDVKFVVFVDGVGGDVDSVACCDEHHAPEADDGFCDFSAVFAFPIGEGVDVDVAHVEGAEVKVCADEEAGDDAVVAAFEEAGVFVDEELEVLFDVGDVEVVECVVCEFLESVVEAGFEGEFF